MKLVNLGTVNKQAIKTPTIPVNRNGSLITVTRTRKASIGCYSTKPGARHLKYINVRVRHGSKYRGAKGNKLTFVLLYNAGNARYYIELYDHNRVRIGGVQNTASLDPANTTEAVVTKINSSIKYKYDFEAELLINDTSVLFDSNVGIENGKKFSGGLGS